MISSSVSRAAGSIYGLACPLFFLILTPSLAAAEEWKSSGRTQYALFHSRYDADNFFAGAGSNSPTDHEINVRLMTGRRWEDRWDTVIHYSASAVSSDSIEAVRGSGAPPAMVGYRTPNDDEQLFNLASVVTDDGGNVRTHRLDRLSVGYSETAYVFRFGRHAVSWGNGVIFQPMDIFNPFSPTAIDKEYKSGDDMAYLQNLLASGNDVQTVLIPRRDITSGQLHADESSLAVKYRHTHGGADIDLLVARHYAENLAGFGFAADWKGAVIRGDLVNSRNNGKSILSGVTSINYSWVWGGYNMTGYAEYFRNGYGITDGDYSALALSTNPALVSRISRGEVFTLGQDYLAAGMTIEWAPRWRLYPVLINNMSDGSWLTQWVASLDWKEDWTLLTGVNLPFGAKGTEYGGIEGTTPGEYIGGGKSLFLQIACYF
ncbi:MAG: hypothetical protein QGI17_13730 [Arenicellales bacterium]|jgi:hypothetical protein|nr:hypothetical protein [Arenicellales bacterium]|tara:strand:- start:286 stop:1581 length:1296 start_codon:yes stop_codon:yes gene_type:complete